MLAKQYVLPSAITCVFQWRIFLHLIAVSELVFASVFPILHSQELHPHLEATADVKTQGASLHSPGKALKAEVLQHYQGIAKSMRSSEHVELWSWRGKRVLAQAQPVLLSRGSSPFPLCAMNCFTAMQEAKAAKAELESGCPTPGIRRGGRPCQELF